MNCAHPLFQEEAVFDSFSSSKYGRKFLILSLPIAYFSFTNGWMLDTMGHDCYMKSMQVVLAVFSISISSFLFSTADISSSC